MALFCSWQTEQCRDLAAKMQDLEAKRKNPKMSMADIARIERNFKMELLNIKEVKRMSRPCPSCRNDIHKFEG